MSKESAKKNRTGSPLWDRAVERYRAELAGNDDYLDVIEVGSLEDLLNGMKLAGPGSATLSSLNRLGPRMKFVDDFSAIIALYFGADARITALVWGSIRMLLTLASSSGDTLVQDVLDMLEELSLTLPRFRAYEETLPMDRALENALLEVYMEVICFYARAIHFFRTHPHTLLRRGAWEEFRTDFGRTVRRIKRLSSAVEAEADIARMRTEKAKYKEVLDLMDDLRVQKTGGGAVTRCHYIPFELNPRFCGRKQALEAIGEALDPGKAPESLKSFALYGMGGVGKTQIALQYARQCRHKYQFILWISADTFINIGQSFRDIARRLKLGENEDELQDAASAILVVKEWLVENNSPWLVIFDNADNLETLKLAWPGGAHGSVLLTTRDFNAAHAPATSGLHVQPFDYILGSQLLLDIIGLDVNVESNRLKAEEIARTLGGLPLALNQIGGFITQRKMPLQDFLPLYERNAPRIDSRKTGLSDYDHTLSTVWEMSLTRLSGDSVELLQLMAFLEPDSIHEEILVEGSKNSGESQFQFMQDEMEYLYEREVYDVARDLISVALDTFLYKGTLAFASAVDLSGLVDLDLNDAQSALDRFHAAYKIRVKCSGPDDPLVAASLNNIALAYTEMEELDKAYEAHMKAIEIRLCSAPDRIGNSYSNLSSLQLRMGKPNEAEKTLKKCPSLLDFTDETFLNTGNPRFSGDMVLFSRIRLRQGRNEDAMRLASKALTFRQKMLGNRLKTCDSLYDVAGILHKQHKLASAM
ncbi:MAG: hypothetical protein Q9157_002578 [Trypethelium eluteriae]